jgi:DNA modification methylase
MNDQSNQPQMEMARLDSIHLNPNRLRKSNRESRRRLSKSVDKFGIKGALIVDRDTRMIVAGNALWEAARDLGLDEVPIILESFATEADRRAFILTHNRLAEDSSWDMKLVQAELKFLLAQHYDFEITGFSTNDLDFAFVTESDPKKDEVIVPNAWARAVSRMGDRWAVGPHVIVCGDSLEPFSYDLALGGKLADAVFSDPPYGVSVSNHVTTTNRFREFAMMSGKQTEAELTAFFRRVFRNCVQYSRPASIHFQCIDWRHVREMIDAAEGVYTEFKNICVWDKGVPALGSMYRSQHEFILVFKSGRGRHVRNFATGKTGRFRSNIWKYERESHFSKDRDEIAHPTPKIPAMIIDAIRDVTNPGDLVLDPFCGSGATAVAAHHAGRRCATIEIDPLYVDAALQRLSKTVGEPAVLADGRTFDEVAADRSNEGADNG